MVSMQNLADRMALIMDLQYQYRSAILFNAVASSEQKEMMVHITSSYNNNRITIRASVERLINAGLLNESILEYKHYEVFVFRFTNLFTTWIINLSIYDAGRGYEASKPIYLEGILSCYEPFLTANGKRECRAVVSMLQDKAADSVSLKR